jgi:hypothetical protein
MTWDCTKNAACVNGLLDTLPKEDQGAYLDLSSKFRWLVQARRHGWMSEFAEQLRSLHAFICRSPANQSVRAMVCGIFFGRDFMLVNTLRLKELLLRSKSGMNKCFQMLGYDVMRPSKELHSLFQMLPPDGRTGIPAQPVVPPDEDRQFHADLPVPHPGGGRGNILG